jgi:hypothetical protein
MKTTHILLAFSGVLVVGWLAGCSKPAEIESLVQHFQSSGFKVTAPDHAMSDLTQGLEAGYNQAVQQGGGRPTLRTLEIGGEQVSILRFESEKLASRMASIKPPPELGRGLPPRYQERYQAEVGEPRLLHHLNFVLLVMARTGEKDNSAQLKRIEATLGQFQP